MKKQTKFIIFIISLVLIVIALALIFNFDTKKPGKYDDFAQCITNSGAKFYGTFWCSHCNNQKKMFGKSVKKLPYVECSTPDGKNQLPICKDNNIEGYPTWVFSDQSRMTGELSFETLSEKTQCKLPTAE